MKFISRRKFVAAVPVSLSLIGSQELLAGKESESPVTLTLRHWVDTLFPGDDFSPGAGALGVHLQILEKADAIPEYGRLIVSGTGWANGMAAVKGISSFAALTELQRVEVVAEAESQGPKSGPGYFFVHTLQDATNFYYGHRESWAGLGIANPPQPLGYPDFEKAPA
ncbi:gluconate 2-dehydrogenase subunit 3 family protein [Verrucomicrobiales bacterium BCK34]|nr:gluconate 2-dehydrogenase subunit 3 family protein [Verrucomicrobiales bacterium BCK34]